MNLNTQISDHKERPPVGIPIQESALVAALEKRVVSLFPPGPGRSIYILHEPELGSGRPDIILLAASSRSVTHFKDSGLRIPTLTAARALNTAVTASHLGVSPQYARSLRKNLSDSGWKLSKINSISNSIYETIGIEAKMSDWRKATRQIARFQGMVDRSIIIMPESKISNISLETIEQYGFGVLSAANSAVEWSSKGRLMPTSPYNKIWLLELLARGIDNGSAYKASALRNNCIASR